jgi:hypothetical membrane protein
MSAEENTSIAPHYHSDSFLAILATCGILGPVLMVLKVIVLGALHPGYKHLRQTVSELGASGAPYALASRVASILAGLLIMAFAYGLHRGMTEGRGSPTGPILLALFAAFAQVGTAIFPLDATGQETVNEMLHGLLGTIGPIAFIIAAFALSKRFEADRRWRRLAAYSSLTGFLVIVAILINVVGGSVLPDWAGGLQRLLIGLVQLYIFILAVQLFRVARASPTTS